MYTVTLSAHEIGLVHNLVDGACMHATPDHMRYLIELERVADALNVAVVAGDDRQFDSPARR